MIFSCKEMVGGYQKVIFYLVEETSGWPTVLTDYNSKDLVFTPNPAVIDGQIEQNSIRVRQRQRTTANGLEFTNTVEFVFNTQSQTLEELLDQYQQKPGVVEVVDNNGLRKIYGSNQHPMYLNFETATGRNPEDGISTAIEITGKSRQRAVYLNN